MEKRQKSLENFWKLGKNFEKSEKVDFNEGKGASFTPINPITLLLERANDRVKHPSLEKSQARQKLSITPIILKVAGCYSHPPLYIKDGDIISQIYHYSQILRNASDKFDKF